MHDEEDDPNIDYEYNYSQQASTAGEATGNSQTATVAPKEAAATTTTTIIDHDYTPSTVMHRIEQLTLALVDCLEQERLPAVSSRDCDVNETNACSVDDEDEDDNDSIASSTASAKGKGDGAAADVVVVVKTQFSLHQARSMTNLFLVLSYCFGLLQQGKTTTVREVVRKRFCL